MRNIAKVNLWDRMKNKIGKFECQWMCEWNLKRPDFCSVLSISITLLCHTNSPRLALHEVAIRLTLVLNNVYGEPVLIAAGLRCGPAAACLMGLWVWILPGAWMLVCYECVLSGRGLCVRLITHPGESYWVWLWSLDNAVLAHLGLLGWDTDISTEPSQ